MKRTIASFLIPIVLVSQSLFSVAHSHAGTPVVEPEGHSSRPHIHLGDSDHHHSHDESARPAEPTEGHIPDHDSDAVYTGDIPLLTGQRINEIHRVEFGNVDSVLVGSAGLRTTRVPARHPLPPLQRPNCARFLQLLSIRC